MMRLGPADLIRAESFDRRGHRLPSMVESIARRDHLLREAARLHCVGGSSRFKRCGQGGQLASSRWLARSPCAPTALERSKHPTLAERWVPRSIRSKSAKKRP
jgi:hypothetical protein